MTKSAVVAPQLCRGLRLVVRILVALVAWALQAASRRPPLLPGRRYGASISQDKRDDVEVLGSIASRVYLDRTEGTASKVYAPPLPVRLLYWLAFQAPFPYRRNIYALKAAQYRRKIAGPLTFYFYGKDLVAPALDVRCDGEDCVFVTELVRGRPARPTREAQRFLEDVSLRFARVGLPTWQLSPLNPKAIGNILLGEDGRYHIIDLESALVSPFIPLSRLRAALRDGTLPSFDDVDFVALRDFVHRNARHMSAVLGAAGMAQLQEAISACEHYTRLWRESEPRLWGRLLRWLYRLTGAAARLRRFYGYAASGGDLAAAWVRKAVLQWQQEGRLNEAMAAQIERSLEGRETQTVLRHLGAHLAISVPLRFPFGSIGRVVWTVAFRLRAEVRALLRHRLDEEARSARRTHTVLVMLLAAVPGIGAAAYLAAEPLRRNRPLVALALDQALRKLPLGLYRRLHLAALTCWLAMPRPDVRKQAARMASWDWFRLSRLRREAHLSWRGLWPHRGLILGIASLNFAALVAAGLAGAATGTAAAFDEMGPITTLKVAELLVAGGAGVLIYKAFWRLPDAEWRSGAAGSFFWLLSGLGLGWLALDDYLLVHERLGVFLAGHVHLPLLNNIDDLIVLGYGVGGLAIVGLFWREILASRAVAALFVGAGAAAGVMLAVDFFAPHGTWLAGLENPAHVTAVGLFLAAYVVKYREVRSLQKAAAPVLLVPTDRPYCLPAPLPAAAGLSPFR